MEQNNQHNEPLTEKEKQLFSTLKDSLQTPEDMESHVLTALHNKNLLSKTNTMKRSIITGIVATITALLCGFFIGQNFNSHPITTTVTDMNKYILFLYENEAFDGKDEGAMVQEYTQWAIDLSEQGKLDNAEKLGSEGEWLGEPSTKNQESQVTGYFIVLANSYNEALDLAKTHPHVGYGGGIEVRPIEKLD